MKILLLGEYSNVHWTLAEGLRQLGQEVTVASNGDFWKNYPRDIDLKRMPTKWGGITLLARLFRLLPKLRGYDVVQLINPMCLELKSEWNARFYQYLRHNNGKMILGAYGMDYYWVHENSTRKPLRYSDFNFGDEVRTDENALREQKDWIGTPKGRLNELIAHDCDAIVAGLYEYWATYQPLFPEKTTFIPFPIKPLDPPPAIVPHDKLRIFIGINKKRSAYKGTDIMLRAARRLEADYPEKVELRVAESVPFAQYREMMNGSDIILDQLYSYTPSMNPLEAMKRGIICCGGGEPENYEILHETELRPILNVQPNEESVYDGLRVLLTHPNLVMQMRRDSVRYIERHHDYKKVARQYLELYRK
ncbi:MAG: glycosyltransferase family 1 protein [Prevotella sp.]|nr:glycosyltransferase family 1 protein [Prevotella sp.]